MYKNQLGEYDICRKPVSFLKYEHKNQQALAINSIWVVSEFNNRNSLFYYFLQRNMRSGRKLHCLKILNLVLRLMRFYAVYFYNKHKDYEMFADGFFFDIGDIKLYSKSLPSFSLKLENEYKGKHKTKRKFIYPVFLERHKSQINELALWLKRSSYKYSYRDYSVRLSIIFFNLIYFLESSKNKISILNNRIFNLQKSSKRFFISEKKLSKDVMPIDEYKKLLWKITLERLKIRVRYRVDEYYRKLVFRYQDDTDYLYQHTLDRVQMRKYIRRFGKSK